MFGPGEKLYYLSDEKTPCIKGEAFAVEHIREGSKPTRVITQTSLFTLSMTSHLHVHKPLSPISMSCTSNFSFTLPKPNADIKSLPNPDEFQLCNLRLAAESMSRPNFSV